MSFHSLSFLDALPHIATATATHPRCIQPFTSHRNILSLIYESPLEIPKCLILSTIPNETTPRPSASHTHPQWVKLNFTNQILRICTRHNDAAVLHQAYIIYSMYLYEYYVGWGNKCELAIVDWFEMVQFSTFSFHSPTIHPQKRGLKFTLYLNGKEKFRFLVSFLLISSWMYPTGFLLSRSMHAIIYLT